MFSNISILLLALFLSSSAAADKEYWIHEKDVIAKLGQLEKAKMALRASIARKSRAQNQEELKKVLQEIQDNFRHLEILKKEYDQEVSHMRFEHPEGYVRGKEEVEVRYRALRLEELNEEVAESGVDLALTDIREQVEKAYDPIEESENPYKKKSEAPLVTPTTLPKRETYEF